MPNADIETARQMGAAYNQASAYTYVGADLSNYWMYIGGLCTRARELQAEPRPWLLQVRAHLSRSFFDWCPDYEPLRSHITPDCTPDLYADFVLHERLREQLLELIDKLLSQ